MDQDKNNVWSTSLAYDEMAKSWELIHDLLGGTVAMRDAAEKWLPREEKETSGAYENRLARTYLYNALNDTREKLVSKPFSQPVVCEGNLPTRLDDIKDNVDLRGRDLTQFGKDVFTAGITYGLTHILIDFPQVPEGATLEQERQMEVRPFFVHIPPTQIIGWRSEQINGEEKLTQIRISETRTEPYGLYGDQEVKYIRVYTTTDWELWRQEIDPITKKEMYVLDSQGLHSFGEVPLVTCYISKTGFMTATPPLEDLAWLNLAHWQSMSDQRNILRFARIGILFGAGFTEDEVDAEITIGANRFLRSMNAEATLKHVEHNGKAIDAGQKDLDKLEERMKVLGMQPLVQRTGNQTATGRALDESRTHTAIQAWIRSIEKTLLQAFKFAAQWVNVEISDDFVVNINNEFGLSERATEDIRSLILLRTTAQISHETLLNEIKRRNLLSESIDVEEEIQRIADEGPPLGSLFTSDEDVIDEDEVEDPEETSAAA